MKTTKRLLGSAAILALAVLGANPAYAEGTAAGSTITNNVTVAYKVGGFDQTAATASNAIIVDRKVNVTVAEVGTTTTSISPNQTAAVTTFQVTNLSNATLDFALLAAQQTGGTAAHGGTDSFDATNVRIYVDSNGNGIFDAATDSLVTYLDEMAADASRTVFVVVDIPTGLSSGAIAGVTLTATGREGGTAAVQGAALVQTTTANTAGMDTVFADGAGVTDLAKDAAFSAADDYTVAAAALSVIKSSKVIWDPVNLFVNPKAIPGASIEYCIAVSNAAGSVLATDVSISDTLPTQVAYDTTTVTGIGIKVNGTVDATNGCLADGVAGGNHAAGVVTGSLSNVAATETKTLVFRAIIQ